MSWSFLCSIIGGEKCYINLDSTIAGSMNDNINMDSTIAGVNE
jgi:hypothetical protein